MSVLSFLVFWMFAPRPSLGNAKSLKRKALRCRVGPKFFVNNRLLLLHNLTKPKIEFNSRRGPNYTIKQQRHSAAKPQPNGAANQTGTRQQIFTTDKTGEHG